MVIRYYIFQILLFSLLIGLALPALKAESSALPAGLQQKPLSTSASSSWILLSADSIDYDREEDIVIASGNVEVVKGDRILKATKLVYNKKTGMMTATGQVRLKEADTFKRRFPIRSSHSAFVEHQDLTLFRLRDSSPLISNPLNLPDLQKQLYHPSNEDEVYSHPQDNILFASYAEFSNNFQDGFINEIKMLMADDARMAANSAKRIGGQKVIFRQAAYTPCNVCQKNPATPPLWQLKADKIIHDKSEKMLVYHHARLEMGGIPFVYLPYFRHADPSVKRKSGFLMPTYAAISDLGTIVSLPYYYVIAPNRDLTLVPIITTKQGPVMVAEYRHRFREGDVTGSASYTQTKDLKKIPKGSGLPGKDRWHIFTQGRFDLDDDHVVSFDINRASDTTYLRRYPILPQGFRLKYPIKNMMSTGAIEQFKDHSYATVRATAYQTDSSGKTPLVLPHGWYNYQTEPGLWNQTLSFDADVLSLARRVDTPGQNARLTQRLSLQGGLRLPYISQQGHAWAFQVNVRGDTYAFEHYKPAITAPVMRSAFRGRLFPTASVQWRYPMKKHLRQAHWVLEPTAMMIGTPHVSNRTIPNEDSLNIQVEDTSLFLPHRFSGLDRVDTGGRFIYGANSTWFFPRQRLVQFFLGHSIRLDRTQVLPQGGGEDKYASDIVSRFRLNPVEGIQLLNRMAWHYQRTRPRISDTSAIFGKKLMILQLNHTFANKYSTANHAGISQASWILGSRPFDRWSFSVGETRNLKRHQRGVLSHSLSALYHDECFRMTLSAFQSRSSDRDIRPNSGFVVQFDFKNLGSLNLLDTIGLNANNVL